MKKVLVLLITLAFSSVMLVGNPIRPVSTNNVEVNEANFPDENFRNWILSNIDAANDDMLTARELELITTIRCTGNQIKDLKGIEFFTSLKALYCTDNQLTALDVSNNQFLNVLYCPNNIITSLNLGNISALTELSCGNNKLTSLDLSNCIALSNLYCDNNLLTSLTFGNISAMKILICDNNKLSSLDLDGFASLTNLSCGSNQLTSLNVCNNKNLKVLVCGNNLLTSLDVSNNSALELLYCGENHLTTLNVGNNYNLHKLSFGHNQLNTIDISNNILLEELTCDENQLTSLDVSNNTFLTFLSCPDNQLNALDVSKNRALTLLQCFHNQIPSLDVSRLTELKSLRCEFNQLTSLEVSNNTKLEELGCSYNPLSSLDLSNNIDLRSLYCNGYPTLPQLINLNLSHNTKLETLWCNQNQLLSLDLSHNSSLSSVIISPQMSSLIWPYTAIDIPDGIAIYVPSDFDISKVTDLQLGGVSITGNTVTVNDLKFLVFANAGTEQSSIHGKTLSYNYNTGNNTAGAMRVEMVLTYTGNTTVWTDSNTERTWIYSISDDKATIGVNTWLADEISIPSTIDGKTVTTISSLAFQACNALTSLTVPSTVTNLGDFVIGGCTGLKKLIVLAETPPTIGDYTFIDYDVPLYVPDVAVNTYQNTDKWKRFSSIKPLSTAYQHNLIYMIDGAVYKTVNYNYGATITPEAAPTKEGYTFSGWSSIPVTMPANDVTVTGTFTINKYKLTYMVDGEEYKSYDIEYGATITPEAWPTKDGYTFSGWNDIPETMPAHDVVVTGTFIQNEQTTEFSFDDVTYDITGEGTVTIVGSDQKGDVEIQSTIDINGQTFYVTAIGDYAFKDNLDMTSLTIPEGVTIIGSYAFEGCLNLTLINIGKDVQKIGSMAFANVGTAASARTRGESPLVVNCYAEKVPDAEYDAFLYTPVEDGTLLVNDNLVDEYKMTAPWCYFGKIMGFDEAAGINTVSIDSANARIYDMQGNRLDNPQKGVNIIRYKDGKAKKMMVK